MTATTKGDEAAALALLDVFKRQLKAQYAACIQTLPNPVSGGREAEWMRPKSLNILRIAYCVSGIRVGSDKVLVFEKRPNKRTDFKIGIVIKVH
jgi:hypothetical protein